ncbi:FG-GAP repeat protein [Candidatus Uhrbacteria bacterium]|nr:FG-GAP repeat protein [Candidatus Uhrbacteria bacterium]
MRVLQVSLKLLLLVFLTGCNLISEDLKASVCDFDSDGHARSSSYCGGADCDDIDSSVNGPLTWYNDVDQDGYGGETQESACSAPAGYVDHNGDCNDTNEFVNPDAVETCNGIDDNCDGGVDDENIPTWYADADADSYGNPDRTLTQCAEPDGYVENDLDCNDLDANSNPEGTEICDDGIDQDCNGIVDDADGSLTWYADVDADGFGDADNILDTCVENPEGYVENSTDCDDGNTNVNPDAREICNDEIDNNCNGETDTDTVELTWYRDADSDGYGDASDSVSDCAPPAGYVELADDCDDTNMAVNPDASEVCNNDIDDNCNDSRDACELSGDVASSTADYELTGESGSDQSGSALASGDLNDDGILDLVVGAPRDDDGGNDAGAAYVFFGPISSSSDLSSANMKLTGEATDDRAGISLFVGDLNDDGVMDLVIGATGEDSGGNGAGAVYVVFGPLASGDLSLADADVKITGEAAEDVFGTSLFVEDLNNDGVMDLVIGAMSEDSGGSSAGAVYVVFGPLSGDLDLADTDVKITGEATGDSLSSSLFVGDLSNDGVMDLVVGATGEDSGGSSSGAAYVVFGPLSADISLADADVKLTGETAYDGSGASLRVEDLNDDGSMDLIVSALGEDSGGSGAGAVYVVFGPLSADISLADADVKLTGEAAVSETGNALASGDFNNDGSMDLVIGASENDSAGTNAGATYLLYGPLTPGTIALSTADFILRGTSSDHLGFCLTAASLTSDTSTDLIVGAYGADTSSSDEGATFIINGLGY